MKKIFLAGLVSCLFAGSAMAETLETDDAIGMASLMMCSTFYSENEMVVEGTIVNRSMSAHREAGIDEMIMTPETSANLDLYVAQFQAADKEQSMKLCDAALKYARESHFVK